MVTTSWNSGTEAEQKAMLRDILEEVALTRCEIGNFVPLTRLQS